MKTNISNMPTPAKWTPDCGGKQDYDGVVLYISTRYWADHSAKPSICLGYGETNEYNYPENSITLAEPKGYITGETEAEVKTKVEEWCREHYERIIKAINKEYQFLDD